MLRVILYFGIGLTEIQAKRFSRLWLNGNLASPSSASGLKLSGSVKKPSTTPWKGKKFGFIPNPQSERAKFLNEDVLPFFYECQWKWSRNARDFVKKFHSEGRRQYDLDYQLSTISLQAAIPEGDLEEEPLKPTSRQGINYKIKKLQGLKEKSEKLKSSIQKESAQWFTKNSRKIISGQECGQRFNEKCLGRIAELQRNIDQSLTRAEAQKEKHKRMYPFAKETFVSKKRRVKENKAKARKRRRERAEKNCKRVFSTISHYSSYGDVITSYHCSVIGLNSLKKRDGRWLKLLISKGQFTVDAIETIKANVSQVVLRAIVDSDDDDDDGDDDDGDDDGDDDEKEEEDDNASEGDGSGEDD